MTNLLGELHLANFG